MFNRDNGSFIKTYVKKTYGNHYSRKQKHFIEIWHHFVSSDSFVLELKVYFKCHIAKMFEAMKSPIFSGNFSVFAVVFNIKCFFSFGLHNVV